MVKLSDELSAHAQAHCIVANVCLQAQKCFRFLSKVGPLSVAGALAVGSFDAMITNSSPVDTLTRNEKLVSALLAVSLVSFVTERRFRFDALAHNHVNAASLFLSLNRRVRSGRYSYREQVYHFRNLVNRYKLPFRDHLLGVARDALTAQ